MYTAKPPAPLYMSIGSQLTTLRRSWRTIPKLDHLQMHAFARLSQQLRLKVKDALLRSLHETSLYKRLILTNKEARAHTLKVGNAIHSRLSSNYWEGTSLLKCVYGQFYNANLAKRYCHTQTNECPLCHKADSCTHIAGECPFHKALTINRLNAECQLVHAAIPKSAKGGGALHNASDLVLITTDTGSQPKPRRIRLSPFTPPP